MNIKFAFAVNSDGVFEKKHFGDSEQFLIYKVLDNKIVYEETIKNQHKKFDEKQEHGSKKKAKEIISLLKSNDIDVLVSMQFGKNIKVINEHFIPIIIYTETVQEVVNVINKHLHWIEEEKNESTENYKLFTIKSGILKSAIKK